MMLRRPCYLFALLVCVATLGVSLHAQDEKTITIRILDARTARPIETSNFLVRINHQRNLHGNWVAEPEGGQAKLTLPGDAAVFSIHATYDSAMSTYVNCDSARDAGRPQERWYTVSTILTSGVVAPNGCSKMIETAKPGEFIFFVRKANWSERVRQDYTEP